MKRSIRLFVIVSIALLLIIIGFGAFGEEQRSFRRYSECQLELSYLFELETNEDEEDNKNDEDVDQLRQVERAACDWWPSQTKPPGRIFHLVEKVA